MIIPLPCEFGNVAECNGMMLPLNGVFWFEWTSGIEYTYFFSKNDFWHETSFYTTFRNEQPCKFEMPDTLTKDTYIKDHGYPLKGRGYACGVHYKEGKTYIEFIMTSHYYAHIKVQCNDRGIYVPNGNIIFPPSWDTEEKKDAVVSKDYKKRKAEEIKGQMSLLDLGVML